MKPLRYVKKLDSLEFKETDMHTCRCTDMYAYMHTCRHTDMHACMQTHRHACMHTRRYTDMHTCIQVDIQTCRCTDMQIEKNLVHFSISASVWFLRFRADLFKNNNKIKVKIRCNERNKINYLKFLFTCEAMSLFASCNMSWKTFWFKWSSTVRTSY